MERRTALSSAAIGFTAALLGCTALTPAAAATALQTDTATLNAALQAMSGELKAANITVPPALTAVLADLNTNATAIGTAITTPPTTVQAILGDIQTIATIATPFFPEIAVFEPLVNAALSMGSVLLADAGITLASAAPAVKPRYTAAEARLILAGMAAKAKK